jgi:anti-sigma-K factor RskA
MDRELSRGEYQDLLAAYSIDAVDDDERRAIEEYLATDPDARSEVVGLQQAASYLAHTGGPPPPGVWEQLESAIRQLPGQQGPGHLPAPPRLVPLARARPRPDRRWHVALVAASIVAVVLGALLAFRDDGSDGRGDTAALAEAADRAPGARHAQLADPDGAVLARAVVLPDGTGYLTSELPALPAGRTYQLWGVDGDDTVSLGVMGPDPRVVSFHAAGNPGALAITEERAGGVAVSANDPAAVGRLRA